MISRVLITGGSGYLGQMFSDLILNTEWNCFSTSEKDIDRLIDIISEYKPDIVIHCGAPSSSDYEDHEFKKATFNLQKLIEAGKQYSFHLIYPQSAVMYNTPVESQGYYEMKIRHNKMLNKEASKIKNMNSFTFTQIVFPRVYSADRTKGLISRIKSNHIYNWNHKIKFTSKGDCMDFLSEFFERFESNRNLFDSATLVVPERYEMSVANIKQFFEI